MRLSLGWQPISSSLSSGCGVTGDTGDEAMALLEGKASGLVRSGVKGVSSKLFSNVVGSECDHYCT